MWRSIEPLGLLLGCRYLVGSDVAMSGTTPGKAPEVQTQLSHSDIPLDFVSTASIGLPRDSQTA